MKPNLSSWLIAISLTIFFVAGFFIWQRYAPLPVPTVISQVQSASASATLRIGIPVLDLDIPVYEGKLEGTKWEYSTIGISHLSTTPWAGQFGNAVYYGHNWPNLLGDLHSIKKGDLLVVTASNNTRHTFIVDSIETVTSDQTRILAPTQDTRLTLFTCTGFLDSKRLVVTARYLAR